MFAIHGIPQTPTSGERFDGPGNSITRSELAALFAVIGTPSWRCIESVANPAWRRYLRKVTGRCVRVCVRTCLCAATRCGGVLLVRCVASTQAQCACDWFLGAGKADHRARYGCGVVLVLSCAC